MAKSRPAREDWEQMSEGLRDEVAASVAARAPLFQPSAAVSREAIRFISPGGSAMLYLRLARGPHPGRDGDGRLLGIKLGPELEQLAAEHAGLI